MATLRPSQSTNLKHKLSSTLRNWLPILHSGLSELHRELEPFVESNPVAEVSSGFERSFEGYKRSLSGSVANSRTDHIEALTIKKDSLYEALDAQIDSKLFPTPISKNIAYFVMQNLDEDGYYEGDSKLFCQENSIAIAEFEKIRSRFAYLEPSGVGASNLLESFLFQLIVSDIKDEAYALAERILKDLQNVHFYSKEPHFSEAMRVIAKFKNPPAIEYAEESMQIVPDLMIFLDDDENLSVKINDEFYPSISIDSSYEGDSGYIASKIKEAKSLIDALDMRRATLHKVGLMIVEYQYEFFMGGSIMPLTLKVVADEFGHNPSTISRAIANKYIACDRGVFAMKDFFTTAIDDDVSNAAIKEFIASQIKSENRLKPLSDIKLLDLVGKKFGVTMVRRTIAKYRKGLNIAGSSERKKLYELTQS